MAGKVVTIYSTPTCPHCIHAKDYFKQKGIEYTDKNVATDMDARVEMKAKSNQMGVPVIDVDGEVVIGFDRGKLEILLGK